MTKAAQAGGAAFNLVGIDHVLQYLIRNGRVGTDGSERTDWNGRVDIFIG